MPSAVNLSCHEIQTDRNKTILDSFTLASKEGIYILAAKKMLNVQIAVIQFKEGIAITMIEYVTFHTT